MELRREAEDVLRSEAAQYGIEIRNGSARTILRALRAREQIGSSAASLFDDILAIGNAAAHDSEAKFTTEDAMRYRVIVDRAISLLDFGPIDITTEMTQ